MPDSNKEKSLHQPIMFLVWLLLVLGLTAAGLLLLVYFSTPYDVVKNFTDSLARDGSVEFLTRELFVRLSIPARIIGIILTLLGFVIGFSRRTAYKIFTGIESWIFRAFAEFTRGFRGLLRAFTELKEQRQYLYFVIAITLFGIFTRLPFLFQPMGHDEAYTVAAYGVAYFRDIISDYWLTNNHIFHSLLVALCYHLFGYAPWSVRLPVFLCGVLVIPATYLVARLFYDRQTALVSAVVVASLPLLVYYSTTARGYIITTVITLLVFALGDYVRRYKNWAAWALIALLSALGFYTIPIMLYPFGILCAWLFLSAIFKDTTNSYGNLLGFLKYLLVCVVITGALTLLFYLPVFFNTGFSPLGSDYLASLPWNMFLDNLKLRLANTWTEFNLDVPSIVGYFLILGFFSSLLFHKSISRIKVPVQLAATLWLGFALLIYRIDPWPKIWTFLLPLIIIWAAAGIISPLRLASRFTFAKVNIASIASTIIIIIVALGGTARTMRYFPYLTGMHGDVESAVLYLKDNLRQGDLFIVAWPDDAPFWYYIKLYEISHDHIDRSKPFERTLVLVNEPNGQTLDSVMEEQGPDLFLFDMDEAKKINQIGDISIYELIPDKRLIEKIYGQ